ncbi:MAG: ABC transporter permease [Verrucomicrobiales bacterium]
MKPRDAANLLALAAKQMLRHRARTALTLLGVATGMFLFTSVETMQGALKRATQAGADDTVLVVYRENRYCPATSRLPEYYGDSIKKIDGVEEVIPIQIVVNNCGASLDVVAFRGVPPDDFARFAPDLEIIGGSLEGWKSRSDAALIGANFAQRRGLKVGDRFDAAGVTVTVAGIARSGSAQDNNVAYVHLPFLQQASRIGLGVVTQFNVRVRSAADLDRVAEAIDERFSTDTKPTHTRPEAAFFAQIAKDLIELIGFTRWLGLGAVAAVLGLVANTVLLVVRGRVQENAVLQTLGFPRGAIGFLVAAEGALLGIAGGLIGVGAAAAFLLWGRFTIGNEGLTLAFVPGLPTIAKGVAAALALGIAASLYPAWVASRQPIVESLRQA